MASSWTPWFEGFGQLDGLDGLQCSPLHGRARAMTEEHYKLSKTIQLSRYSLINMTLSLINMTLLEKRVAFRRQSVLGLRLRATSPP